MERCRMVDLTDPSPLVMTHFELTGFLAAVLGVLAVAISDYLRRRRGGG